jgi:energy-coupling factor transport system permease protein
MKHHVAWLLWACSAAAIALLTLNPFYLLIIALAAWLVGAMAGQGSVASQSWRGLLKVGALVWLLTIPFNALMIHQGHVILFRLPANWPLIGGNVTLEAAIYGAASGLRLWVLLIVFAAFNLSVDASQLLRLTPAFLYQVGVVTSIALTFMPQMLASAKEIREAQQIRGHRFRGWRDLLPLIMPLLTTSFERAIQLAESMESRGFGRGGTLTPAPAVLRRLTSQQAKRIMTAGQPANNLRLLMLVGLGLLLYGLFLCTYWPSFPWPGIMLLIAAAGVLMFVFYSLGRRVQRSHYRPARWQRGDTVLSLANLLMVAGVLLLRARDGLALAYYPYPPYPLLPDFNPWIGLLLVLLAMPGLLPLLDREVKQ